MLNVGVDVSKSNLQPDYSLTTKEVYATAVKWIIKHHRDLQVFSLMEPKYKLDLPSWVPDFRVYQPFYFTYDAPFAKGKQSPVWYASGSTRTDLLAEPLLQLTVRTLYVGTITRRSNRPDHFQSTVAVGQRLWDGGEWQTFARDGAIEGIYAPTGEQMDLVFQRLRIWDIIPSMGRENVTAVAREARSAPLREVLPLAPETQRWDPTTMRVIGPTNDMANRVLQTTWRNCLFWTDSGYLGMAHTRLQIGDEIFVLMGADCPFVLRCQGGNRYALTAEAYVHGIMDGEMLIKARGELDDDGRLPDAQSADWLDELGHMSWDEWPFKTEEIVLV